mmetsp:Transcript_50307/g.113023  ORF Transcript_50307/g.113023 Transcript_50307/m.113023 type:complete len:361 (-) Transcript_50307:406-1488(-)
MVVDQAHHPADISMVGTAAGGPGLYIPQSGPRFALPPPHRPVGAMAHKAAARVLAHPTFFGNVFHLLPRYRFPLGVHLLAAEYRAAGGDALLPAGLSLPDVRGRLGHAQHTSGRCHPGAAAAHGLQRLRGQVRYHDVVQHDRRLQACPRLLRQDRRGEEAVDGRGVQHELCPGRHVRGLGPLLLRQHGFGCDASRAAEEDPAGRCEGLRGPPPHRRQDLRAHLRCRSCLPDFPHLVQMATGSRPLRIAPLRLLDPVLHSGGQLVLIKRGHLQPLHYRAQVCAADNHGPVQPKPQVLEHQDHGSRRLLGLVDHDLHPGRVSSHRGAEQSAGCVLPDLRHGHCLHDQPQGLVALERVVQRRG